MPRQRAQLTDQALIAVAIARRQRDADADLLDLLLGLSVDDEAHGPALVGLATRARPPLPALEVALRWAVDDVGDARPLWTADLRHALMDVGGSRLAEHLDAHHLGHGWRRPAVVTDPVLADELGRSRETFGLGGPDAWDTLAGLVVARTRALGGGPLHLALTLAVDAAEALPPPWTDVRAAWMARAERLRPVPAWPQDAGDAELEEVLAAATRLSGGAGTAGAGVLRLAHALELVGGAWPARLLADAEALPA